MDLWSWVHVTKAKTEVSNTARSEKSVHFRLTNGTHPLIPDWVESSAV